MNSVAKCIENAYMLWFNFKGRKIPFDLTNKTSFPIDAKIAKKN